MGSTATSSSAGVPTTFLDDAELPKLIVFDLDYTLWPFWVDTHVSPPLKAKDDGKEAIDRTGGNFGFYREVPSILLAARARSVPLGIASRTCTPDRAVSLLKILKVPRSSHSDTATSSEALSFFAHKEIYPGDKRTHLKRLSKSSGVRYEDILFFDDEHRNSNVEALGVCFWLVHDGVSIAEIDKGVREWRRQRQT